MRTPHATPPELARKTLAYMFLEAAFHTEAAQYAVDVHMSAYTIQSRGSKPLRVHWHGFGGAI